MTTTTPRRRRQKREPTPLELQAAAMREEHLLANVLAAAAKLSWRTVHFRPGKTHDGWRTPVQGDGKGFPDLMLLKGRYCLAVECKSETGKLTPEQRAWLDAFAAAGVETHIWRPSDLLSGAIAAVLGR